MTMINTTENSNSLLRVLLADDSAAARRKLRETLQSLPFIQIVGEAGKGDEALDLFLLTRPDVVVAAVCLPQDGGFHILRCIKRAAADCAVILTNRGSNPFVHEAARLLGAAGVCPANDGFLQLRGILESLWNRK
jgi:two-component system, NarL family, response regulator DevR